MLCRVPLLNCRDKPLAVALDEKQRFAWKASVWAETAAYEEKTRFAWRKALLDVSLIFRVPQEEVP